MDWIGTVMTAVGSSVITCVVMERYFCRRAENEMGDYDRVEEESTHRKG